MDTPFAIHPITPASNRVFMASGPSTRHRHEHQQVLIITKGGGVHHIDGEAHPVAPPMGMLVATGKVHLFMPSMDTEGWCIDFREEFLPLESTWLFSPFFELSNVPLGEGLLLEQSTALCRLLFSTSRNGASAAQAVLRHLLSALLQALQTEIQEAATRTRPHRASDFAIFRQFMRQLEASFTTRKEVAFYSRQMRLTPKRLGAVCKASLGKTPQEIIIERCMIEAKRLLLHSGQSIQEVGFALGYEDPSHFSKAFRQATGETPSAFRRARILISIKE